MSDQPEALRLADALEISSNHGIRREAAAELRRLHAEVEEQCRLNGMGSEREAKLMAENEALRAALAEPVEPVAWGVFGANLHDMFFTEEEAHEMAVLKGDGSTVAPLYAAPPQRPAEPVQEPVAWQWLDTGTFRKKLPKTAERCAWNPLYAAPPQRKPLTDEEIKAVIRAGEYDTMEEFARAIEQAHGIGGKT